MPHLIIEFSSNLLEKNNLTHLMSECHKVLRDTLPTALDSCKSRAVENSAYCVGDGAQKNAFVHVSLKIMPGRTTETLQNVGDILMKMFKEYFVKSEQELSLKITLEIAELQTYFKS